MIQKLRLLHSSAQLLIEQRLQQQKAEDEKSREKEEKPGPDLHTVDVNSVESSTIRQIVAESVSLHVFKQFFPQKDTQRAHLFINVLAYPSQVMRHQLRAMSERDGPDCGNTCQHMYE